MSRATSQPVPQPLPTKALPHFAEQLEPALLGTSSGCNWVRQKVKMCHYPDFAPVVWTRCAINPCSCPANSRQHLNSSHLLLSLLLLKPPPLLLPHSPPASPVSSSRTEDEEILDTLSTNFDIPLYSCPEADWTKIPYGGQDSSNEAASPDSSFIDQSWDETQTLPTLPLFEPTLDFETCLMDFD